MKNVGKLKKLLQEFVICQDWFLKITNANTYCYLFYAITDYNIFKYQYFELKLMHFFTKRDLQNFN